MVAGRKLEVAEHHTPGEEGHHTLEAEGHHTLVVVELHILGVEGHHMLAGDIPVLGHHSPGEEDSPDPQQVLRSSPGELKVVVVGGRQGQSREGGLRRRGEYSLCLLY